MSVALAYPLYDNEEFFAANDNAPYRVGGDNVVPFHPKPGPKIGSPNRFIHGPSFGAHCGRVYDKSDQPTVVSGTANGVGTANGNYRYDGNLKRVKSVVNGKTIYNIYNAAGTLVHVDEDTENKQTDYVKAGGMAVARVTGTGGVLYEHADLLGSPRSLTNVSGSPDEKAFYSPFGMEYGNTNVKGDQAGFTGPLPRPSARIIDPLDQLFGNANPLRSIKDSATGLNYMQARYYDPVMGRFLSIDPVTFLDTGDPRYFNRYAYTANDPINSYDPNGEVIKLVKSAYNVGKRTYKNGGNLKGALKDEALSYIDNGATILDPSASVGDKLFAAFDLATGFGGELKATQKAANSALKKVGDGKGAVHGTKVHTEFAKQLGGNKNIATEVSYKDGKVVSYGTKGSVRVDAVIGDINNPSGVVDLKTGAAKLSEGRAAKIQNHLPNKCDVFCTKPD